jgi:hypothetical protein
MNRSSKKLIELVRESVHRIDPYALIAEGAPEDEFNSEILAIAGKVSRCSSPHEVAQAIAGIFSKAFSEEIPVSAYYEEASSLFARLQEEGLVQ